MNMGPHPCDKKNGVPLEFVKKAAIIVNIQKYIASVGLREVLWFRCILPMRGIIINQFVNFHHGVAFKIALHLSAVANDVACGHAAPNLTNREVS